METDGEQQRYHARKILPWATEENSADGSYSQAQLYSLVSDIPSYSSFIPFCTHSTVLSSEWKPSDQPFDVDAELTVGFGGLEEKYISRVAGRPFETVTVGRLSSPTHRSPVLLPH